MVYDYETINEKGIKYGFVNTGSQVVVYVNDKKWGVPQGSRFIKALLDDIKELPNIAPCEYIDRNISDCNKEKCNRVSCSQYK